MRRIIIVLTFFVSPAFAQVIQNDESLHEQLVPESFQLQASGVAEKFNWWWNTTITYSLVSTNHGCDAVISSLRCRMGSRMALGL